MLMLTYFIGNPECLSHSNLSTILLIIVLHTELTITFVINVAKSI